MAAQTGRAERGDGRVFQPRYRDRATGEWRTSPTWWIQYYQRDANGRAKQVRENSHSTKKAAAKNLLRDRLAEVRQYGRPIGRDAERTTFADLKAMLLDDYQVHGRRSLKRATISVAHLHESFGRSRAVDITADRVTAYIRDRQAAQAKPATIQKELAALKRMFTLAIQARRLTPAHRPYIPQLKIQNTRSGFFEEPEFRAVLAHLPEDLKPVAEFMYLTGWRIGEVLTLEWRQVDFKANTVRLDPGTTKNDEGRTFPFAALPALEMLLRCQRERAETVERAQTRIIPWVFHRRGKPIKDIRGAWETATEAAGLAGRIPHDFRRTAVRNLERAGVPRSVAMKLTGHKTESVYRRYAIVSEADLSAGVAKLAALHADEAAGARAERKVVAIGKASGHAGDSSKARAKQARVAGGARIGAGATSA